MCDVDHRPMLVRRLVGLEKKLRVPPELRHQCEGEMQKTVEVYVKGSRVWKSARTPDFSWRNLAGRSSMTPISLDKAWGPLSPMSAKSDKAMASAPKKPRELYKAVCLGCYDDHQKIDIRPTG